MFRAILRYFHTTDTHLPHSAPRRTPVVIGCRVTTEERTPPNVLRANAATSQSPALVLSGRGQDGGTSLLADFVDRHAGGCSREPQAFPGDVQDREVADDAVDDARPSEWECAVFDNLGGAVLATWSVRTMTRLVPPGPWRRPSP
jgi:hypothetical protein